MSNEYILFTDKPETFECMVDVKNASLKGSLARIILETNDVNLIFNGKIQNNKCIVPIKKMKGILDESSTGKMILEIIVEDTYFTPWTSQFLIKEDKSVKIMSINENKENSKPTVSVVSVKENVAEPSTPISLNENTPPSSIGPPKKILNKVSGKKSENPLDIIQSVINSKKEEKSIDEVCNILIKKHKEKEITLKNISGKFDDSKKIFDSFFSKNNKLKLYEKEIMKKTISRL